MKFVKCIGLTALACVTVFATYNLSIIGMNADDNLLAIAGALSLFLIPVEIYFYLVTLWNWSFGNG